MSLEAKDSGGQDFEPITAGVHHAVCSKIYDLGTHHYEWKGKETEAHKILITWEVPGEIIEIDGEDVPRIISREYTLSLSNKSNLRPALEAWRGKKFSEKELQGFNVEKLLGANCQLQVVHVKKEDRTYGNIAAIMSLPKGTKKLDAYNGTHVYKIEDGQNFPESTPEWIKKKILNSKELKSVELRGMGETTSRTNEQGDIADEEIPF